MIEDKEIRKKAMERAGNTIVRCPYCKESHSVASGWFFNDNPQASRDGNKIGYCPNMYDLIWHKRNPSMPMSSPQDPLSLPG